MGQFGRLTTRPA